MSKCDSTGLNLGLSIRNYRPLRVRTPEVHRQNHSQMVNVALLQTQTFGSSFSKGEALGEELATFLERIDQKVNLLTLLTTALLETSNQLPSQHEFLLYETVIFLRDDDVFESMKNQFCEIELFLFDSVALPLKLVGRLVSSDFSKEFPLLLEFDHEDSELSGLLGKFIFQAHRREIAMGRAHPLESDT